MNKIFLLLFISLSISFLGLRDTPTQKYRMYNDKVILRDDGALYLKGKINLKFKDPISLRSTTEFGINQIDNIIREFKVNKIYQRYPLKTDISKRMTGDENLAKIYTFYYDSNIDPTELSEIIFEQNKELLDWIEPDFVYEADYIPNDPSINSQYHINKINSYQAWDFTKGDTNVVIGIVDSGSDLDHPDLAANIKYNYADPINNVDDDINGYIDDFMGWDFYFGDNDPNIVGTGNTHGSHVSGCASQVTDNGVHGAGIGFKLKLKISKHCDDSNPESLLYNTPDGMTYLYQNGCKVINCSFGSSSPSSFVQTIIDNAWAAGTIFVASAGNGNPGQDQIRYPGAYNHVVCVAATNSTDIKASFSHYHDTVDVSAPGESILSTVFNNGYASFNGTSMSSPITAGTVALIRSQYPSWTPQQVVDRLELGVDSIYHLNPSYVGKLGTGRINAFKCLADKPIISVLNYSHNDSIFGNNDKVYDVNEKIPIKFTYKNIWVAGNNVSLRLSTTDPNVEIVKDSLFVGNLAAYTTYTTEFNNTFEVRAKSSCPFDRTVIFKIKHSNTAYGNDQGVTMSVTFRQGWVTHNINNLKLSLTKDGAIGKKTQAYGSGLLIGSAPQNNIYEGGLMIGTSNTKVSDDCRIGTVGNLSDTDFTPLASYILTTPGTLSHQDGSGLFNDNGAGANKIGVEVKASSYAFSSSGDADYILLKYRIKNTSGANITNMHAGVYMFFAPNGVNSGNITKFDAVNKIGYSYNSSNPTPYLGISLLSNQNTKFRGMMGVEVLTGFTTDEKWNALSGGIHDTISIPGINCFVISAGPLSINNNDSVVVAFAVVKGNNLSSLQANSNTAKNKYNALIGISQISSELPVKYELYQNYPNPFNPSTKIKFSVPKDENVVLKIYDIIGREVITLINTKIKAGFYEYTFDGNNISSGVYFYKFEASGFRDIKKMVLVK